MLLIVTALLAGLLGALGIAKVLAIEPMSAAASHVGFSINAYRLIGSAEIAATAGIVAGHRWMPLGLAAAGGLLALMAGAVVAHLRAGDPVSRCLPAIAVALLTGGYTALLAGGAS